MLNNVSLTTPILSDCNSVSSIPSVRKLSQTGSSLQSSHETGCCYSCLTYIKNFFNSIWQWWIGLCCKNESSNLLLSKPVVHATLEILIDKLFTNDLIKNQISPTSFLVTVSLNNKLLMAHQDILIGEKGLSDFKKALCEAIEKNLPEELKPNVFLFIKSAIIEGTDIQDKPLLYKTLIGISGMDPTQPLIGRTVDESRKEKTDLEKLFSEKPEIVDDFFKFISEKPKN